LVYNTTIRSGLGLQRDIFGQSLVENIIECSRTFIRGRPDDISRYIRSGWNSQCLPFLVWRPIITRKEHNFVVDYGKGSEDQRGNGICF